MFQYLNFIILAAHQIVVVSGRRIIWRLTVDHIVRYLLYGAVTETNVDDVVRCRK